ncbi:MAG: 2-oxoglutarate dehydrogenase complex dihydrolipoyllysine-residue succinyltransferase [Spirochaetota bacterium]
MKKEIEVPEIGESISSGILAAWLKEDGAQVEEGEEIFELETDKATLGVPSPAAGVLHQGASEGDEVEVGQSVGRIDTEGTPSAGAGESGGTEDTTSDKKSDATSAKKDAEPTSPPAGGPSTAAKSTASGGGEPATKGGAHADSPAAESLSPAVRRVVAEHSLDASKITGTGPGGRITKADAERAARGESAPGGGAGGGGSAGKSASASGANPPALGSPEMPTNERQRRVPLSNLRKRIAENLVYSKQSSAHVTTFNEVDMSAVMELRSKYKEQFNEKHGVRLGFMSFFVKASQYALQAFPEVNAYLDGTDVLYNDYVNIGVALSSEKGLLTPVLKDVEVKSFADIEQQIIDFSTRANNRRLKPDEMVGATFTISNGGVFGSLLSTPIPSPPQTAVLGMHSIQKRPIAMGDQVVIRPMMYLALTYDHRMIDGREAVLFLGRIREFVEDPSRLLLGV